MSTPEIVPPVETAAPMSEMQRLTGVFFEPGKAFADIVKRSSWWVPFVILSILSLCFVGLVDKRIGWDQVVEHQMHQSPKTAAQLEKLPPDQQQKQIAFGTTLAKGIAWGSPLLMLIGAVIVAAALMVVYNFGMGSKVGFGQSLSITIYSWLPGVISTLLAIVTLYIVDPDVYDINKPVASNLGVFVDAQAHHFSAGVLSAFDIFTIWGIFLMAVGFEQCSKVKRWVGFGAIFGVYFVYKVITSGLGSLAS